MPTEGSAQHRWPLFISALVASGIGYYAVTYGIAAVPPFVALLFVSTATIALNSALEWVGTTLQNPTIRAANAIAFMISMISGLIVLGWITTGILLSLPSQIEKSLAFGSPVLLITNAFALMLSLYAALVALNRAIVMWRMVRADHFGST